jgi:hypothetical protein
MTVSDRGLAAGGRAPGRGSDREPFVVGSRRASPAKEGFVLKSCRHGGLTALLLGAGLAACSPTVKVEAPDKPIVINMNVKIEQEVRVKIEEQARKDIAQNPDIF